MSTHGDSPTTGQASVALAAPMAGRTTTTTMPPHLVVRQSIEASDLRRLFDCLREEDCVHSWKNVGLESRRTVEGLVEWENQRRPTELFFFYAERGSHVQLVAASAVAERLTHEFPYAGFCVLTRCYIMPEFRGQGLYRPILHYRLEYCRERWGNGLHGIHIGTVDERIARSITRRSLPGWPTFAHIGKEELRVAGEVRTVDDYMLLTPEYVRRLQHALTGADAPSCVDELRERLSMLESAGEGDLGLFIKERVEEAHVHGWFDHHDARDLERLLLFCGSIPLLGFDKKGG